MIRTTAIIVLLIGCCFEGFITDCFSQPGGKRTRSNPKIDQSPTTAQATVKLYPKVIRVQVGKTKTITAAAFDSNNQSVFDANFEVFSSSNNSVASLSPVRISGDDITVPTAPPPNLRSISGNAAGTATIVASWNGITSSTATVIVDDARFAPSAIIHGDNDELGGAVINTPVGEPIEVDAESSRGVNEIEWTWGDGDLTTNLLSAAHAYLIPGTYALNLKITNSSGQAASTIVTVNVRPQPSPTQSIYVTNIQELLTAYNNASGGEHIVIPAGTILDGEIVLPAKTFSDYVTIRSSAPMPDIRNRVSPNDSGLVTVRGTYGNAVPLTIQKGASKIRIVGIKFEPKYIPDVDGPSTYYLAQIGEVYSQSDANQNPSKIILEHCVVNPPDEVSVVHAILNDGYKVSIISSWLGNIRTLGSQDSQAVVSFDGRGAHVYNNTFFEAASENVMYGGTQPRIEGITPSNIEFRRCYFSKRLSWRVFVGDTHPINVKNLLETKNARRMYVEGSVFENHWDALRSQLFAFVFKTAAMPGTIGQFVPWAISEDIVLENNKVSHIYGGVTNSVDNYGLSKFFGLKPNNIIFQNVLFDDLSERWGLPENMGTSAGGRLVQPYNVEDLQLNHVTVIDRDRTLGTSILFVSNNNFRFKVTNSIFGLGGYGIIGSGTSPGIRALNPGTGGTDGAGCLQSSSSTWKLSNNVMPVLGVDLNCFPTQPQLQNQFPADYETIGFTDFANDNFTLSQNSPYRRTATDGTDPGINYSLLAQRTACTVSGIGANCAVNGSDSTISVTGRVLDSSNRPISRAVVIMTDVSGKQFAGRTSSFGYYVIPNVRQGQYTFSVSDKRHRWNPVVRTVDAQMNIVDLVAVGY